MTEDDRAPFAVGLTALAEVFGEELSTPRVALYFAALDDLPLEIVQRAMGLVVRQATFFPRPAEIRSAAGDLRPDPGTLYAALIRAKRARGAYFAPPADLPRVLRLLVERLGGWGNVMGMSDDHTWLRIRELTPPLLTACVARGIALRLGRYDGQPVALPRGEVRLLEAAAEPSEPGATPLPAEVVRGLLRDVAKPMLQHDGEGNPVQTEEEIEARRALLREQAARLREDAG